MGWMPSPRRRGLSKRQIEVLTCLAKGHSTLDCADEMGIATATVRVHAQTVRMRLGARTIAQAVALGIAYGYIDPQDIVDWTGRTGKYSRDAQTDS